MKIELNIAGIKNYTGFCDKNGNRIFIGDRLEFIDYSGAVWRATVEYDDGIISVDFTSLEQIKNPKGWKRIHNWVNSRHCGCQIGYPEYGTWNHHRKSLPYIAGYFKEFADYKKAADKHLKKYGGYNHQSLFRPLPCKRIEKHQSNEN